MPRRLPKDSHKRCKIIKRPKFKDVFKKASKHAYKKPPNEEPPCNKKEVLCNNKSRKRHTTRNSKKVNRDIWENVKKHKKEKPTAKKEQHGTEGGGKCDRKDALNERKVT